MFPPATPRAHVLVVDDDPDMLEMAKMILEPEGYAVDTAADGRLGLAAARRKVYDVIVLDITMPNMNGIELGNALRDDPLTSSAAIVVHTSLEEGWVRMFFNGYDLFLAKPSAHSEMLEGISVLLAAGNSQAQPH